MKTTSHSVRRSADHWQALVEQFEQSGLSAMQFCQEHQLGYASFCQWRRRLADEGAAQATGSKTAAEFVDLSALGAASTGGWQIVLSLGGGVELRLSRT
jgi:hypothetical protein